MRLCNNTPRKHDRGFAWIVLFASFVIQMMIDGLLSTYGIFYPIISEENNNSTRWQLILPNSLQSGFDLLAGSFTGALMNRIGMHIVATIGAFITCISLLSSAYVTSFALFTVIYGVCAGIGLSLMLIPAIVAVNLYFKKLRPLAAGLSMTGSGFGYIFLPLLTKGLLEMYEWRDCLKIIAGIFIICIIASLFFQPFVEAKTIRFDDINTESTEYKETGDHEEKDKLTEKQNHNFNNPSIVISNLKPFSSAPMINHQNDHVSCNFKSEMKLNKYHQSSTVIVRPLSRHDIFYSGVLNDLPNDEKNDQQIEVTNCDSQPTSLNGCINDFFMTFDFGLFRNLEFNFIVLISVLEQLSYFIPFVYLNDYASRAKGVSGNHLTYIALALGVSTTVGRAIGGLLANVKGIHPLHLSFASVCLCGICSMCVPLCHTANLLIIYAAVQGFALAVAVVLQPLLLVEYIGIRRLTAAFGNVSMLKGFFSFIGTPIAAVLYESTGNYDSVFFWAGGCFLAAILPHIFLYSLMYFHKKNVSEDLSICSGSA